MSQMLPRKMLIGTALGCILVGVLVAVGLRLARPKIVSTVIEHRMRIDYAACNAAPAAWGFVSGEVSLFAYDRTGRSLNPAAPIDTISFVKHSPKKKWHYKSLRIRCSSLFLAKPKALARIRGTTNNDHCSLSPHLVRAPELCSLGAICCIRGLLAGGSTAARIEEASMAAQSVGSDSFTPCPKNSDVLGQIAEVLQRVIKESWTQKSARVTESGA